MDITTKYIFNGASITADTSSESDPINLQGMANDGVLSLYIYEAGDGTGQWTYMLSPNGSDYVEFTDAADIIAAAFTKISGPGADGYDIIQFSPELAPFIKIKVTETVKSDAITPVAYLIIK